MRKVLTFVAAVCCMMFLSVSNAWGQASDGVYLTVDGTSVTTDNEADIFSDGLAIYDATDHVLTLKDGFVAENGIVINASGKLLNVKIRIEGDVTIKNDGIALRHSSYNSYYPLIIEGDENATLLIENTGSSDVPALLCAKEVTSSNQDDAFVLKMQGGITVNVKNESASSASAILCNSLKLDGVTLSMLAPTGVNAYKCLTAGDPVEATNTACCSNGVNKVAYYKYTTLYPVCIDGFWLSDGKPELSAEDKEAINNGTASYDPETRTLLLKNNFRVNSNSGIVDAAVIINNSTNPEDVVTIKVDQSTSSNPVFYALEAGQIGLLVKTPTVIDINGEFLDVISAGGDALKVDGTSLTIRNSDQSNSGESGYLTISSEYERGLVGSSGGTGDVKVERCKVYFQAMKELCDGLNSLTLSEDIQWDNEDYGWDAEEKALVKLEDKTKCTDSDIRLEYGAWYISARVEPAGVGKVDLFAWNGEAFEEVEQPYRYVQPATSIRSAASSTADDWEFYNWEDGTYANPAEDNVYKENIEKVAQFSRTVNTEATYYYCDSYGEVYPFFKKLRETGPESIKLPKSTGSYIRGGAFVEGKLYYLEENGSYEIALYAAAFDGKKFEAPATKVAAQTTYAPIYAMAYSTTDSKFYFVAKKGDNNVLLSLDPESDTEFQEVAALEAEMNDKIQAMAVNAAGTIYAVTKESEKEAKLWTIDNASAIATEIGVLDGVEPSYDYKTTVMAFDPESDELILEAGYSSQRIVLVHLDNAKCDFIADAYSMAILFAGPAKYAIQGIYAEGMYGWGNVKNSLDYTNATVLLSEGEELFFKAEPTQNHTFLRWSDGETANPRKVTVGTEDKSYYAEFESPQLYTISVALAEGQDGWGEVSINYYFSSVERLEGAELLLEAASNTGYRFVKWDDENTEAVRTITVGKEDKVYTAIFEAIPMHKLSVSAEANGEAKIQGDVTEKDVYEGDEINIIAIPDAGYVFDQWDDGNTDNPRRIKMETADQSYTASFISGSAFKVATFVSPLSTYGNAYLPGKVTTAEYKDGAEILLTAEPKDWTRFVKWQKNGSDVSTDLTYSVIVDADVQYTAVFEAIVTHAVYGKVEEGQDLWGSVAVVNNDGLNYGEAGTEIELKAIPSSEDFQFVEWKEDHETANPRTIVIGSSDVTYTAVFKYEPMKRSQITVAVNDASMGEAEIVGFGSTGKFKEGEVLSLKATPNTDYVFVKWDDEATDATRSYTVGTEDKTFTAIFEPDGVFYTITVLNEDDAKGTVSPAGANKVKEGFSFTMMATPKKGYLFAGWLLNDELVSEATTFSITATEDATYKATWKVDENMKLYPITIGGVELYSGATTVVSPNAEFPALKNGSIVYTPDENTLWLYATEIEATGDAAGLVLGGAEAKKQELTVIVVGNSEIKAEAEALKIADFRSVKLYDSGDAQLVLTSSNGTGIALDGSDLIIESLKTLVSGKMNGIAGTESETVTVIGAPVEVKGEAGSIVGLGSLETEYCKMKPGKFIDDNHQVEIDGSVATVNIVFEPWKSITVKPVEEFSGHFTLSSENGTETFTDKGWFEEGDIVTITAEAEANFEFARWMDDSKWKDEEERMGEEREYKMGTTDKEFTALFYFTPKSSATWYGINKDNKFVQFEMSERGYEVIKAKKPNGTFKAGDYMDGNWYFVEGTNLKELEVDGSFEDDQDLTEDKEIETPYKNAPASLTDMACNLMGDEIYAVAGDELWGADEDEGKFVKVGTLKDEDGNAISVTAIAADAKGTFYVLAPGTEGKLYTFSSSDIDEDEKEVILTIVGEEENEGKIGVAVASAQQSIAFDHATGELFWGAEDYLRIIDVNEPAAHIVGDLGATGGAQGYIKSLHKMDKVVTVKVAVAEGQSSFGTVNVKGKEKAKFFAGEKATIEAKPATGYKFSHWMRKTGSGQEKEFSGNTNATCTVNAVAATFIAYFVKGQGLEDVQAENAENQKVLIDGTLYIIREGRIYNASGLLVK